jgi:RHS repeat-associated protein
MEFRFRLQTSHIALLLGLILCGELHAQVELPSPYTSVKSNYIKIWNNTVPENDPNNLSTKPISETRYSAQHFDGLGRLLEVIMKQGSPLQKDVVSPVVYDSYGRKKYKYLSFTSTSDDGSFKMNPFQQQVAFYNNYLSEQANETNQGPDNLNWAYSKTDFEESPLGRINTIYAAGYSWVGNNRGVSVDYEVNEINEVRIWSISGTGLQLPTSTGWYGVGELYRTVIIDEHGKRTVSYMDKEGKLILKKAEIKHDGAALIINHSGWLNTYYIYDNYDNLRFVISPKAVEAIETTWSFGTTNFNSSEVAKELCFYYEYDQRNRMIQKKVAGAGEVYFIYDARDRVVMVQDANMRNNNNWVVTKYDILNRAIESGIWMSTTDVNSHRTNAAVSTSYPNTSSNYELLSETHYDDYTGIPSGLSATLNNTYINSTNFISTYNSSPFYAQPISQAFDTRGFVTWTRSKVLGSTNTFIESALIYDSRGRIIQIQIKNHTGGINIITTQFDYNSKVLRIHTKAQKLGGTTHEYQLLTKIEYDHTSRIKNIKKVLTVGANTYNEKVIVQNEYDELGQLENKKLGTKPGTTDPLETLTYDYNILGWVLGMNKNYIKESTESGYTERWFGFELNYDKDGYATTLNKQYNGNAGSMLWKSTGDDKQRKYDFGYDPTNRLLKADYTQKNASSWNTSEGLNFSMQMGDGINPTSAYDANGNIKSVTQYGWKVTGSSIIDNLTYNYTANSNKLLNVIDGANDASTKLGDFRTSLLHPNQNKNSSTIDYTYDVNGNLKKDLNKDIGTPSLEDIVYNHLNLPQSITVRTTGGTIKGTITYSYDAAGNKLQKIVTEAGQSTKTTLYIGDAAYENDVLQFIAHEEGRIRYNPANTNNPYPYDYFIKDHLGNTRMVLTEEAQLDQYPQLTFEDVELSEQNASWENANGQSINVTGVRTGGVSGFNSQTGNGSYVRLIKKSTGAIGAGKLLKVMAGDRIHTKIDYYYTDANANNSGANPLNSFVTSLTSVLGANTQVGPLLKNDASTITTQLSGNSAFTTMINPNPNTSGGNEAPKAYLNVLFFDDQFKFDANSSIVIKVNYSPNTKQTIDRTFSNAITANKSGYVYLYFSNESETQIWFDNFNLTHEHSALLEETHFYPFGLQMAGISSKAFKSNGSIENNKSKFQSQEFDQDLGLNWFQFKWRNHDPQIGRFVEIDPLSENFPFNSTYAFSGNKVTSHIELEGLETASARFAELYRQLEPQLTLTVRGTDFQLDADGMITNGIFIKSDRIKRLEKNDTEQKSAIVLHRTVSETAGQALNSFKDSGVGTHFLIGTDGVIYQTASLNKRTSHLRDRKELLVDNVYNQNSIGIEVVGMPLDKDGNITKDDKIAVSWQPLTTAQTISVAYLVNSLMTTYGLTIDDIYTHERVQIKLAGEGQTVYEASSPFFNPFVSMLNKIRRREEQETKIREFILKLPKTTIPGDSIHKAKEKAKDPPAAAPASDPA